MGTERVRAHPRTRARAYLDPPTPPCQPQPQENFPSPPRYYQLMEFPLMTPPGSPPPQYQPLPNHHSPSYSLLDLAASTRYPSESFEDSEGPPHSSLTPSLSQAMKPTQRVKLNTNNPSLPQRPDILLEKKVEQLSSIQVAHNKKNVEMMKGKTEKLTPERMLPN